jgi:hypothetical protein
MPSLFANNDINFIILEKSFSCDLSDSFNSDRLLNAHIQLTGEAHAGTIDLTQNVHVLFLFVPVQNEVCSPD